MRVLICGSRGWHNPDPINAVIAGYDVLSDGQGTPLTIIHGDAPGADRLAKSLGHEWRANVIDEPAEWGKYGKRAGPIRNQKMLDLHEPNVVWAFRASGKSSGTDDMIARAKSAGVPVFVVSEG